MRKTWQRISVLTAIAASIGLPTQTVVAQEELIEEVVTVGSRNTAKPRSASDSPVPIDVINDEDFNALGSTADLTDNLRALIPSYTATPATGDGSAFVRPTSLRGTAPDQTLVLVNGKRRHRAALVLLGGFGAHGPDLATIPSIAIKSVESTFPIQVERRVVSTGQSSSQVSARIRGGPEGGLARLLEPLMARMAQRSVDQDYDRLVEYLESASRT